MSAYQVQLSMRLFMPIGIAQKKNNQQTHKKRMQHSEIKCIKNYGFLL